MAKTPALDPAFIALVLNRLGYGPCPSDFVTFSQAGFAGWLEQQLSPPQGDTPEMAQRLAATTLKIHYSPKTMGLMVDEMRPLSAIDAPIETVWPSLFDHDKPVDGNERNRLRDEVIAATLLRAVHSPYQVREMMAQFWHDHFNVDAYGSEQVSVALPAYDRDVVRRHCLGNFREFLEAVAGSTAMLYYLSNRSSRAGAANENYGRELLELHTLGRAAYLNDRYDRWRNVPGALQGNPVGYIDQDVYEAARAFTGWTVEDGTRLDGQRQLPNSGKFVYVDAWHDGYQKRVLGQEFDPFSPAMADGRRVLDLLAEHPATAIHIVTKLCHRIVGPKKTSAALIAKATNVWQKNVKAHNQIAQVVHFIALSPEFAGSPGDKVKRPLALAASFARITGMDLVPTQGLAYALTNAGQRLFGWPTPTGLTDDNATFLGTNVMRSRWQLLLGLAQNSWGNGICTPSRVMMPALTLAEGANFWLEAFSVPVDPVLVEAMAVAIGGTPQQPMSGYAGQPDGEKRLAAIVAMAAMAPAFQTS
jgi:uncharacterized protein (DUF1800 family)